MKNRKYGRMVAMALAAMMAMPTVAFAATTWDEDTAYYGALEQGKVPEEVMKQDEMGQYVISDGTATTPEGGETTYLLVTPEGAEAEFVFSDSLLARPDGMYTVEALSTEELEKLEDLKNAQDAIDRTREGIKKRTE